MWTKISFVTIYAVLSQNLFCRDLRAFAWRKVETKNCVCGEKRTNLRYAFNYHSTSNIHENTKFPIELKLSAELSFDSPGSCSATSSGRHFEAWSKSIILYTCFFPCTNLRSWFLCMRLALDKRTSLYSVSNFLRWSLSGVLKYSIDSRSSSQRTPS